MSASGRVSRAWPVHTVARNCTRDEGRPFGFGDQVADPKPPRAAAVKSRGGERRGNARTMIPAGKIERGERKQTASEASTLSGSYFARSHITDATISLFKNGLTNGGVLSARRSFFSSM